MTKSIGVGRGGHRPGAGRKRKAKSAPRERREVPKTSANVADVEALAKSYTSLALLTLAEIALNGEKEAARVAAANALLDRGHGKPGGAGAAAGGEGKKAQRQANAEKSASGGRFAAPGAPKLAVDNTR